MVEQSLQILASEDKPITNTTNAKSLVSAVSIMLRSCVKVTQDKPPYCVLLVCIGPITAAGVILPGLSQLRL